MTRKRRPIPEQLREIEECLGNARQYVSRNVNVRGSSWLHLCDWRGTSGHPLWMKNHMIPSLLKSRANKERALKKIADKRKDKRLSMRRRFGGCNV